MLKRFVVSVLLITVMAPGFLAAPACCFSAPSPTARLAQPACCPSASCVATHDACQLEARQQDIEPASSLKTHASLKKTVYNVPSTLHVSASRILDVPGVLSALQRLFSSIHPSGSFPLRL